MNILDYIISSALLVALIAACYGHAQAVWADYDKDDTN